LASLVLQNNADGSTARDDTAVNAPLDEFWRAINLDPCGVFLGCRFGIPALSGRKYQKRAVSSRGKAPIGHEK
jgi:hypothetical protein